jgi:hypothetical protein
VKKCLALWCVSILLAAGAAVAFDEPRNEDRTAEPRGALEAPKGKKQSRPPHPFAPEREAAAMAFVRRHHPELARLLENLKKTDLREYHRAVGALYTASQRLANVQQRNPELYEREIREWKLKSHIQLLVAQTRMTPDDETLRQVLRKSLIEQLELRKAKLVEERNRLAERLEKMDQQISEMKHDLATLADKQMDVLLRDRKKHNIQEESGRGVPRDNDGKREDNGPRGNGRHQAGRTPLKSSL